MLDSKRTIRSLRPSMFGCGRCFAGVAVECIGEIVNYLFPQRQRFEHFGFGSEAQHPGFDFFGGGELELGDDRAVSLGQQLLRGVPAFFLDVPRDLGVEADSHGEGFFGAASVDAPTAGEVLLKIKVGRLRKLQQLHVDVANAVQLVVPHFRVMWSEGHEVERVLREHQRVRVDVVSDRLRRRLRLVGDPRQPLTRAV